MFGMGMPEILLILAIALIVLGPKKLPEIAKSLGKGIAEFKKATQDFKQSINTNEDFKDAKDTLKDMKTDIQGAVNNATRPDATVGTRSPQEETSEKETPEQDGASKPPKEETPEKDASADETPSQKAEKEDEEKGPSNNA